MTTFLSMKICTRLDEFNKSCLRDVYLPITLPIGHNIIIQINSLTVLIFTSKLKAMI